MTPVYKPTISPILIGRDQEFATLNHALNAAIQGQGQVFLVAGDAGVGKTRLLNEFYYHAKQVGILRIRGYAFEEESALPFSIWIDALRDFSGSHTSEEYDAAFSPFATDLIKLAPEVAYRYPTIASTPSLGAEIARRRVFDALASFFASLARSKAMLMLLEDVHWSDKTSLDFLIFFIRRISSLPILLLVSYRHHELSPHLQHFVAQLDRERLCQEMVLNPLTRAEVEQMSNAILESVHPLHSRFVDDLYSYTEGNPFYIEEVLKLWRETGKFQAGEVKRDQKSLSPLPIPRSVVDAVQRRTANLSPQAKHILAVSAVIGRVFNDALLAEMFPDYDLIALLNELLDSELIQEELLDVYAFRHAITREVIYATLLRRQRKQLHQQIAETMERYYAPVIDRWIGSLAYHAYEAGLWQQALDYSERAGREAQSLYADREAIVHFTRAMEAERQMEQLPSTTILRARGKAYETAGEFDLAQTDYEQTLTIAQQNADGAMEWQALIDLGFLWSAYDYARTEEYFQRALTLARTLEQTTLVAHSLNRIGNWFANVEQLEVALRFHNEALSLFAELNDLRGLAETYDLLGMTHQLNSNLVQAYHAFQQAIARWKELQDRAGLVSSLACLPLCTASYLKNLEFPALSLQTAIDAAEEARRIAQAIKWRAGESFVTLIMAMTLGAQGEYASALEAAQTSLRHAEEIEHRQWIVGAQVALGTIYLDLLDFEAARARLEQALRLAKAIGSQVWIGASVGYLGVAYVASGLIDNAISLLDGLVPAHTPLQMQGQRLAWYAKGELALATGDASTAERIALDLIESAANLADSQVIPRLWYFHGRTLAAQNKDSQACTILLAALQRASEQGARPLQWRIQATLGKSYLRLRRKEDAEMNFASARSTIHDLASQLSAQELRQRFVEEALGMMPAPSAPTATQLAKQKFGGLTAREREIALLIAQGKSNQEIAAALFVGVRTVEAHITRILTKFDFTSRVQIAAWVVERRLTQPSGGGDQ